MRIVGTNHGGYANDRNITALPFRDYRVVRSRNFYRLANFLHFKVKGKLHPFYPWLHWDGGWANCDILHFFNGISLGKKPWLSTFETYLPRWGSYGGGRIEWGLERLAGKPCKRLIALSACTQHIQSSFLEDYPDFASPILQKVCVLHPSQAPILGPDAITAKFEDQEQIRCLMVGADFFRKGGREILMAFDKLISQGAPLHLTIVSAMHIGDYASHATEQDRKLAREIIARHPRQIEWLEGLPNSEVMRRCAAAHVGLLPTWADTYGYAALEFMAAGCPVISTDIRALPEINGPDRGWLIPCEKDDWGNAILETDAHRKAFSEHLLHALLDILEEISQHPQKIAHKGWAAYQHILTHHDPQKAANQLSSWYDAALSDS